MPITLADSCVAYGLEFMWMYCQLLPFGGGKVNE